MNETNNDNYTSDRNRRKGGGRKELVVKIPDLAMKMREPFEPSVACNPKTSIIWVSRSLRHLESELNASGYEISYAKIGHRFHDMGYELKGNIKTREVKKHPGRNEQLQHINGTSIAFMEHIDLVISVDAKKKELIGNFRNYGKECKPPGEVD